MAKINYYVYKIIRHGMYNAKNNKGIYTDLTEIFSGLKSWLAGKTISRTQTYGPLKEEGECQTYCYQLADNFSNGNTPSSKKFLITIWNGVPTNNGQVAAIDGTAEQGKAKSETSSFSDEYIPGYPNFFLIMPEKGYAIAIRFEGQTISIQNMSDYMRGFIGLASRPVELTKTSKNRFFVTCKGPNGDEIEGYPSFKMTRAVQGAKIEYIRSNCSKIHKLLRKDKIEPIVKAKANEFWQMMANIMTEQTLSNIGSEPIEFESSIKFTPNHEELDSIINAWKNGRKTGRLGFKLSNDDKIYWLDKMSVSGEFEIDASPDKAGLVDASVLLAQLERHCDEMLPSEK